MPSDIDIGCLPSCGFPLQAGQHEDGHAARLGRRHNITIYRHLCLWCRQESIRTAFLLSQGGEFAFVLLSLANELKVLPTDLNRLLIIVVVLSMALTPFLAEAGKRFAESTLEDDSDGEAPS